MRYKDKTLSWPFILTVLTALLAGGMIYGLQFMPELQIGVYLAVGALGLMILAVWLFIGQKNNNRAFWAQVIAMTVFSVILVTLLIPQASPNFTSREIAQEFQVQYDGKSPVYIEKFLHPGFSFYSGHYGQEVKTVGDIVTAIHLSQRAYLVIRQSEYQRLPATEQQLVKPLAVRADKVLLLKE